MKGLSRVSWMILILIIVVVAVALFVFGKSFGIPYALY